MTKLPSCVTSDAGTFSTLSQASLAANNVINLTQQSLVGTNIFYTPPNTINLQPGNYVVTYSLMGNPAAASELVSVALQLNGVIITQSTIGASSIGNTTAYPEATGSYFIIATAVNNTLRLIARTPVDYNVPAVNAILTSNNAQTAQLTIFKI